MDHEAADARRNIPEIDRRAKSAGLAEQHIAVAGLGTRARRRTGTVGKERPDDKVVEAVAVDVPGGGNRNAGIIVRIRAVDHEAADAGGDVHEIDRRTESASVAEYHIAVAGFDAGARRRAGAIATGCPDDEVVEAVAIDISG